MKIIILSDIHGNIEALNELPESGDEVWILGDLVNYGPNPREVIEFARTSAALAVRGNHDDAIGFDRDPHCSERFREMARQTGAFTREVVTEEERAYLRGLPLRAGRSIDDVRFVLVHATPADPLYEYRRESDDAWQRYAEDCGCDVLLTGHTHIPFIRRCGPALVCNPGSLGQPKNGSPRACYAVWDDGNLELKSFEYQVQSTANKIRRMRLSGDVVRDLTAVLLAGAVPQPH